MNYLFSTGRAGRFPLQRMPLYQLGRVLLPALVCLLAALRPADAQSFRFFLRAEPQIIPANGVSTTSILVQVQNSGGADLSPSSIVRFVTTRGVIESQAQLVGGVARVQLRSSSTPGTAIVTAIIGSAREDVSVEFSGDIGDVARYLEIAGPYVDYNSERGLVSASGLSSLDFGDLHLESDVSLVVDLFTERIWAEGTSGGVLIRRGKGPHAPAVRGDRLYYDLRRLQGVMRRVNSTDGPLREEFEGYKFQPPATAKTKKVEAAQPAGNATAPDTADGETPRVLAIDGVAARLALERSLTQTDGFALSGGDAAADELPLLKSPATEKESNTARTTPVSASRPPQRATIWFTGSDSSTPAVQLFTATAPSAPPTNEPMVPGEPVVPNEPVVPGEPIISEGPAADELAVPGDEVAPAPSITVEPRLPAAAASGVQPDVHFVEPIRPEFDRERGYWITTRRIRVFPQDKIQFERATIFFNGTKLFSMPLYVLSLTGTRNPVAGMLGFNTSGGLSLNVPFYYMASPGGTGAVYLQHAPGQGFAAEKPGFALAIEQQYYLSGNSHGKFYVDQIGHGDWNFNWEHSLQISPTTTSRVYVNMPRHRDFYTYGTIVKDFSSFQLGLEGTYNRPETGENSMQGQLFFRLRPRALGHSGWGYTVSANALARRYTRFASIPTPGGGGVTLPGQSPLPFDEQQARETSLFGQTLNLSLQSPTYRPWSGATVQASVLGTAFNYSDGRRGVSPGLLVGWRQSIGRVAALQLDYSYDKGGVGLYDVDFTHYISGGLSLYLGRRVSANAFLTHSLNNGSLYGTAGLDYYFRPKWRLGLFSDYSSFNGDEDFLSYGFTLGRMVGQREVTLNWDSERGKFYFALGGFRL